MKASNLDKFFKGNTLVVFFYRILNVRYKYIYETKHIGKAY